jgi:phosphatidylserine/phosphatidylglycerophosphate/cardiolipin synthase-like enzyme
VWLLTRKYTGQRPVSRQHVIEFGTFWEDRHIISAFETVAVDTAFLTAVRDATENDTIGREITPCNHLARVTARNKTRAYRGESKSALHTKAIVFDRESVFVGSFNLDPRSGSINTEAGIYVESPELAEGVQPENSYRVQLDESGDLYWVTEVDGNEVRYYKEPQTTFGQRFMSGFIMILPVEHQL